MIVDELRRAGVDLQPLDAMLIEGLAVQLAIIRRARADARADSTVAPVAKEIETNSWSLAVDLANELMLPEEALKRIVWLN
jgi:hypothetical protein